MNIYSIPFEDFAKHRPWRFNLVEDVDALNRRIAREVVDAIKSAGGAGREILVITPIGPLELSYWAALCNEENVSCKPLRTMNMDEYLGEEGSYIPVEHPLSFRRYMQNQFVDKLRPALRPDPANIMFPDPREPQRTTKLIESFGGADLCYGGIGISGHFAFNDPPEPDQPCDDEQVRNSRTRTLTINRESMTQMCMGGTFGNWEIIPKRAVTLGMYELLMSKKMHLTFMRSWHSGTMRRGLFGPISGRWPGSFLQQHPNLEITVTRLTAAVPSVNVPQAVGSDASVARGCLRP